MSRWLRVPRTRSADVKGSEMALDRSLASIDGHSARESASMVMCFADMVARREEDGKGKGRVGWAGLCRVGLVAHCLVELFNT